MARLTSCLGCRASRPSQLVARTALALVCGWGVGARGGVRLGGGLWRGGPGRQDLHDDRRYTAPSRPHQRPGLHLHRACHQRRGRGPSVRSISSGHPRSPDRRHLPRPHPTRVLDTRTGTGLSGPFTNHAARTFTVSGVPADATAVTGNLTVTGQTSLGYLFIGPVATNNPTSSTLNFPVGDDRANAVTVALGAGGTLSITFVAPSNGPTAHAIFDVTGYFTPDTSGATYHALSPPESSTPVTAPAVCRVPSPTMPPEPSRSPAYPRVPSPSPAT